MHRPGTTMAVTSPFGSWIITSSIGIVVSDWGAINDRVEGIKAGNDLEMPGNKGMNDRKIIKAVKAGTLSMEELDACVLRLIKFAIECKPNETFGEIDFETHHKLARKAAANGAVLMKNDGAQYNYPIRYHRPAMPNS